MSAVLTDAMRAYFRAAPPDCLLYDFVLGLIRTFDLTPEAAGQVIGEWIREVYP